MNAHDKEKVLRVLTKELIGSIESIGNIDTHYIELYFRFLQILKKTINLTEKK